MISEQLADLSSLQFAGDAMNYLLFVNLHLLNQII
jgi:hypothetical protein